MKDCLSNINPKYNIVNDKLLCSMAFNCHNSSVSFAIGTKVVLVLEAERIFRQKKKLCNKEEMEYLVKYGLNLLNKNIEDINYWAMTTTNNPYLERSDIVNIEGKKLKEPYWKDLLILGVNTKALIINHHLSHAGIYLSSEFKKAIIISCDGGGDYIDDINIQESLAVYLGDGDNIIKQEIINEDYISGKTYAVCSAFLYGTYVYASVEGKLMALACFGEVRDEYYNFLNDNFHEIEKTEVNLVLKILEDSFPLLKGQAIFQTKDAKDFAATIQKFFVDKRLEDLQLIFDKFCTTEKELVLTGGASLNLDLNTVILNKFPKFKQFIPPCCDDTGQSLGAICILINKVSNLRPDVNYPYLGEGNANYTYTLETLDKAVDILLKDGIIIIHNGKSEIGPRALGNRSFIARPDKIKVKKNLSENIKQRESYRPIAPIVLEDKVNEYFVGPKTSPFMLYKYEVIESQINKLLGAIHVDNSSRVQTINHNSNPFIYDLIKRFGDRTGIYVLLNTSLNFPGYPITNKIEESIEIYNKIIGIKCIIYNGEILKSQKNIFNNTKDIIKFLKNLVYSIHVTFNRNCRFTKCRKINAI